MSRPTLLRWFSLRSSVPFGLSGGRRDSLPVSLATTAALVVAACGGGEPDGRASGADDPSVGDVVSTASQDGSGLGTVSFPTSCAPEVQGDFDRAVAMLHSFWFDEAQAAFESVAEQDPDCAMAHWGIAMNSWGNPMTRAEPSPDLTLRGEEAVARARDLADDATERERMYIEAAGALYDDHESVGHIQRMRAHEDAMRRVMEAYPDDDEAAIFYGRIVVGNAPPDDQTYARQLHAAEIMEPLFEEHPRHPGLAHYLIHAFDAPPIAERGSEAAMRYADVAPEAPHALHMPTHIFTRLGYWEQSVELNQRSAEAQPVPDAAVHPLDYMVYAYLQMGQDDAAAEVIERATSGTDSFYGGLLGYNYAAMQARYALERDRWAEAAELPLGEDLPPYVMGVTRFARGIGSARSGRTQQAREEVQALARLRDELEAAGDSYWPTVLDAQRLAVAAWVARADGDDDEALRLASEAADLESTVEKHPVTPGPILPARELLGDLQMEMGNPEAAQRAYETTLEEEPRRARALHGAARAAEAAGDPEAAGGHYDELLELLSDADPDRPDLNAAREWEARM